MATPKGKRTVKVSINETDSVHVYSDKKRIMLQLRRDYPTERDILTSSFKTAVEISPMQALAIAAELLTAASASGVIEEKEKKPKPELTVIASLPENHGKQWTPEEDKKLVSRYYSKLTIEEIAKKHKRGIGGVQVRLTKLGKLSPPNSTNGTQPVADNSVAR